MRCLLWQFLCNIVLIIYTSDLFFCPLTVMFASTKTNYFQSSLLLSASQVAAFFLGKQNKTKQKQPNPSTHQSDKESLCFIPSSCRIFSQTRAVQFIIPFLRLVNILKAKYIVNQVKSSPFLSCRILGIICLRREKTLDFKPKVDNEIIEFKLSVLCTEKITDISR